MCSFLVQATQTSSDRPLPKDEWADLALSKDKLEEKRLNVNLVWQGYGTSPSELIAHILEHAQVCKCNCTDSQMLVLRMDER